MQKRSPKQPIKSIVQKTVRKQVGGSKTGRMRKLKTNGEKPKQIIRKKKPLTRSRSNVFSKVQNDYEFSRQHTPHLICSKNSICLFFDNAFPQKVGPPYSPDGPMLVFEILGESKCKISRNNDSDLRTGTDPANTEAPYLSNNALHALFSECTVSANGVKISNTN